MTTVNADRAASTIPARTMVGADFCEVSTYECDSTASGVVIQMCKVAAGATLLDLHVVFDDLGTSVTIDVGDGDDPNRYISALDVATAAGVGRLSAGTAFPHTYAAEDTIDITIGGAAATGTITLVARFTMQGVDLV